MTFVRALTRPERRAIQATAFGTWPGESSGETYAGTSVDPGNAMQLLTVYGCVAFIADGISTLPVDVYRNTPTGKVEAPKPEWLVHPTPDLTFESWAGQVLTSLLIAGNAYLFRDITPSGAMTLAPIDPTKVDVRRQGGRKFFLIDGQMFDSARVVHIPGLMYPGSDVGLSPVEMARQTIGGGMAAEEFAGKFFDQGAVMSGVIEVPGDLNPDNARLMAKSWKRAHSGKDKAHLPGVLVGGATWKPTGVTNDQAQFLETRKFTAAQIAGLMFRIDPSELGIAVDGTSLTYANQQQRNIRKREVTFLPWTVRLETAISAMLPQPRYMKFNFEGLLRGDVKTRFETYKLASDINTAAAAIGQPPLLTTPEMREFEDFEPLAPTEPA